MHIYGSKLGVESPNVGNIPGPDAVAGAAQVAHSSWANCVPRGLGRAPAVVRRVAEVGETEVGFTHGRNNGYAICNHQNL